MTVKATNLIPEAKSGISSIKPHMVVGTADAATDISVALDSNENAFGPSPKAHAAALAATDHLERYLENPAHILAPALASCYGLEEDRIAIGFGSDDLLARIARAYLQPGTALLRSQNSYLKVPNYAYSNDAEAVAAPDRNFCTDVDAMLSCLTAETRIVYLANPDNPSGAMLPETELRHLHAGLPRDVLLVIDGAYSEYVTDPAYENGEALVREHDNVVLTRSFSKIYGLAGARVGWAYGPPHVIDTITRIGLTFPLATPSLHAAIAALEDREHRDYVRSETALLRDEATQKLSEAGIHVYPGHGNFILMEMASPKSLAREMDTALRAEGISLRRFASPAFDRCLRMTLGRHSETRTATDAIIRLYHEKRKARA
jgi:histidinol-phosphate aminotransferase